MVFRGRITSAGDGRHTRCLYGHKRKWILRKSPQSRGETARCAVGGKCARRDGICIISPTNEKNTWSYLVIFNRKYRKHYSVQVQDKGVVDGHGAKEIVPKAIDKRATIS